jgi:hypothetical protein
MGIVGDARNNFVRVDVQYDDTRAIRVTGLADTQIRAGSPDVVQISSNEVLVPDFLWEVEIGDDYLPVPHDDRDLLINLNGGDDLLQIVGSDWNSYDSPFLDDLLINTGGGESIVEIDNVLLQDALSYLSGAAVDVLSIFGASRARALQVSTGGGDDIVRIGEPGPAVYDGDPPTKIVMGHFHYNPHDVYTGRSFINTGGGADSVALRGGMYHDVSVILGAGSDKFALESSKCSGLMVSTGAGADQMTFKDIESRGIELRFADRFDVLRIDRVRDGGFRQTGNQRFLVELPANGPAVHAFADDQQDELMPGMPTNRLRDSIIELFGNVGVWGLITDVRFAATDF